MIRIKTLALILPGIFWLGQPIPNALAQSLNFGGGDTPVEVFADNGIEWQQDRLVFVARGNARAVRGPVTVFADELRAYYRKRHDGRTDIWRLDALGKVRIKSSMARLMGIMAFTTSMTAFWCLLDRSP